MGIRPVLVLLIASLLTACGSIPQTGEVVYARIVQVFSVEKFNRARTDKASFKGFFLKRELSMLEAARKEGLGVEDIHQGRLVSVDCSCGAECYIEFPVLLPEGVDPRLYDQLLEVEIGRTDYLSTAEGYGFSLGKYRRMIDVPREDWARFTGNHERMPACDPGLWQSLQSPSR